MKLRDILSSVINLTIAGLIIAMIGMAMAPPQKATPVKRLKPSILHVIKGDAKTKLTDKSPGTCRLEWKEVGKNSTTGAWLPFRAKANLEREALEVSKKNSSTKVEVYCK